MFDEGVELSEDGLHEGADDGEGGLDVSVTVSSCAGEVSLATPLWECGVGGGWLLRVPPPPRFARDFPRRPGGGEKTLRLRLGRICDRRVRHGA